MTGNTYSVTSWRKKDSNAGIEEIERISDHLLTRYIKYQFNQVDSFEARCLRWRPTRIMYNPSTDIFGKVEETNDENEEEVEEKSEEEQEEKEDTSSSEKEEEEPDS